MLRSPAGPLLRGWAPDRQGATTVDRRGTTETTLLYVKACERLRVVLLGGLRAEARVEVECRCGSQQPTVGWIGEQIAAGRRRVIYPPSR